MLTRFRVSGYRCFKDPVEIDFTDKKNYQFGKECVRGDLLDKVIIVGMNGSGKTNFGYALVDIVNTVTGYRRDIGQCDELCFLNADSDSGVAEFRYEFSLRGSYVVYEYGKRTPFDLVYERLEIDRSVIYDYDLRLTSDRDPVFNLGLVDADGVDVTVMDGTVSLLKMIMDRSYQDKTSVVRAVSEFASSCLYYRAMWKKDEHIGLIDQDDDVEGYVIGNGLIGELSDFLKEVGVADTELSCTNGTLMIRRSNGSLPFFTAASRGTMILCRLFCWIRRCSTNGSMMFLDDFDDMYHYQSAENAIRKIISSTRAQCLFVTHNTGLISNDFLRPDCCFILNDGRLSSLASLTDKDIRRGHNLEKMLRGGEFD